MKTQKKSQSKGITFNPTVVIIASLITGVGLIGLRIYQMLNIIDYKTGFFSEPKNVTVTAFYVLFVLFVAVTAAVSSRTDVKLADTLPARVSYLHAGASLLLAMGFIEAFKRGMEKLALKISESGLTQNDYLISKKAYAEFLSPIFALVSTAVLLATVLSSITGNPFIARLKVLHLFPSLFLFSVCVKYFGVNASYLKESQFLLLIFATAFFMLFMFEYARFVSGVGAQASKRIFFASGIISIGLFLALLVPIYIVGFLNKDFTGVQEADFYWWQAAAPVFALSAIILRAVQDKKEKNTTDIENEA